MKKLNKKVLAGAGLGAVALVGGSFAYYNQTVSLENPLNTGHYNNELVEDFTPPTDELKPGATVDKVVGARNTGDYPVLVRIRMDETWKRSNNGTIEDIISQSSDEYNAFELNETGSLPEYITSQQTKNGNTDGDEDGDTTGDGSVVRKNLNADNKDKWVYNKNDGYWYYTSILQPEGEEGDETGAFLDSITLATNVDLGLYETKDWYFVGTAEPDPEKNESWNLYTVERNSKGDVTDIEIGGKSITDLNDDGFINAIDMAKYLNVNPDTQTLFRKNESLLNDSMKGYADANYTLTMTSQFVQATPDAIEDAFGTATDLPQAIQDIISDLEEELTVEPTTGAAGA